MHETGTSNDGAGQDVLVLDSIERALRDLAEGRAIVVVDDEDRENEGDILFPAEHASPELVAFAMTHCRGLLCVALEPARVEALSLEQMAARNTESMQTAFTVSVDAREGIATGISAADRARTIRLLADPATSPADLVRPGHVFPLRAKHGGVLRRPGHTEAAVDLPRLAGLQPAGVICEIVNEDGTMARLPELRLFASNHGLSLVSIADLIAHRRRDEVQVVRVAEAVLPTVHGGFRAVGFRSVLDGTDHVACVLGEFGPADEVLVRVHSECLLADALGSQLCDCGPQLDAALSAVAREGKGVVLYMRGEAARRAGLVAELTACESGPGRPNAVSDGRDYGLGAQILIDLGVRRLRLLSNDLTQRKGFDGFDLEIVGVQPLGP